MAKKKARKSKVTTLVSMSKRLHQELKKLNEKMPHGYEVNKRKR